MPLLHGSWFVRSSSTAVMAGYRCRSSSSSDCMRARSQWRTGTKRSPRTRAPSQRHTARACRPGPSKRCPRPAPHGWSATMHGIGRGRGLRMASSSRINHWHRHSTHGPGRRPAGSACGGSCRPRTWCAAFRRSLDSGRRAIRTILAPASTKPLRCSRRGARPVNRTCWSTHCASGRSIANEVAVPACDTHDGAGSTCFAAVDAARSRILPSRIQPASQSVRSTRRNLRATRQEAPP